MEADGERNVSHNNLFTISAIQFVVCAFTTLISILSLCLVVLIISAYITRKQCKKKKAENTQKTIGFFHPYCNAGGGGEKVLWSGIRAIQEKYPNIKIVVYTGDTDASPEQILQRAARILNMKVMKPVQFVYLWRRKWVEASRYPYFTLLGQSFGSMFLALEALYAFVPDIYIDTMGYAFTMPLFKYLGTCHVITYTHYPTITEDMLSRVAHRRVAHNNRRIVANSPFLTLGKVVYYKLFAAMYRVIGRTADVIMVNSSWTEEHINKLWDCPLKTRRVYPPCDVDDLKELPLPKPIPTRIIKDCDCSTKKSMNVLQKKDPKHECPTKERSTMKIISVAQFRPEKDHPLQLRAMYQLREMLHEEDWKDVLLVIIGSCRNEDDKKLLKDIQDLSKHLSVEDNVEFKVNISYEELKKEMSEAMIGLHTMWNEHFGIGVVEMMAAGLVVVAHRSGGPRLDIIEESEESRTGYLAVTDEEFASSIANILSSTGERRHKIGLAARSSVDRFSVAEFEQNFLEVIDHFVR